MSRVSCIRALAAFTLLLALAIAVGLPGRPAHGQLGGAFESLPDLQVARSFHQATALDGGRVLITGGFAEGSPTNTGVAEIYFPDTAEFIDAGLMRLPRSGHSATLLLDGGVLIAGGSSLPFVPVAGAERFDAGSGLFADTGGMLGPRTLHTATRLQDGRVLIVGGLSGGAGSELASAEVYDPLAGAFAATGAMIEPRVSHTATLLPDGRVLIAGGTGPSGEPAGTELYVPDTGSFSTAVAMVIPRSSHAALGMPDGRVFVFGGVDAEFRQLAAVEVFDPVAGSFRAVASMNRTRQGHTVTLLLDNRILILGGLDAPDLAEAAAELYNPAAEGSAGFLDAVRVTRSFHSATRLPDGRVVVAGGLGPVAAGSAERFTPPPPPDRDVALVAGWNLVTWTGEETPTAVAIAGVPAIASVFGWDAEAQDFRAFRRGAPGALNSLAVVRTGDALWLFAGQPTIWRMPDFGLARIVTLVAGFNLSGWTGPDGASVGAITGALGPSVIAVYAYDPLSTAFRVFRSEGPDFLNTATTINHGDGIWLEVSTPLAWQQPATGLN